MTQKIIYGSNVRRKISGKNKKSLILKGFLSTVILFAFIYTKIFTEKSKNYLSVALNYITIHS